MEHEIYIERYGTLYRGACECGWEGDAREIREEAFADSEEHQQLMVQNTKGRHETHR